MSEVREIASGWIWSANVKPLVHLLSLTVGYRFDDWDWGGIDSGLANTDARELDGWLTYPIMGAPELELNLANAVGSDVVKVVIRSGHLDAVLKARLETILVVLSEYEVTELA